MGREKIKSIILILLLIVVLVFSIYEITNYSSDKSYSKGFGDGQNYLINHIQTTANIPVVYRTENSSIIHWISLENICRGIQ